MPRRPTAPLPLFWLLMTYADMGKVEEARATAKELFELRPNYKVKRFVHGIQYKDRSKVEQRLDSLRKLGLPEMKLD